MANQGTAFDAQKKCSNAFGNLVYSAEVTLSIDVVVSRNAVT